jgi:hypothetical protein
MKEFEHLRFLNEDEIEKELEDLQELHPPRVRCLNSMLGHFNRPWAVALSSEEDQAVNSGTRRLFEISAADRATIQR